MRWIRLRRSTRIAPRDPAPGRPKAGPGPLGGLPRSGWGLTILGARQRVGGYQIRGDYIYRTSRTSYSRMPDGACTSATSPTDLPISARAMGLDTEIRLDRMSASSSPTTW